MESINLCVFCGARPNFIKVAPIIRVIDRLSGSEKRRGVSYSLVYAGRADDPTLEDGLFASLSIRRPDVCLGVECENLNELTGQVMSKFEQYLQANPTDIVIVVDDLASTMAAAIVTKKQAITLAHIAAGTRSFDITMPKEINRLVIDGLSDILFTAGFSNNSIANKEGAELSKVYMVGNILIDNIRYNRERIEKMRLSDIEALSGLPLKERGYLVFTLNRKALLADQENLEKMLRVLVETAAGLPVIAPLRDSAVQVVLALALKKNINLHNLHIVKPLGYLDFSCLTAHARGIITDSGNVAEEATFNSVPCITLNSYTEHIETVKVGSNVLVGENADLLRRRRGLRTVEEVWNSRALGWSFGRAHCPDSPGTSLRTSPSWGRSRRSGCVETETGCLGEGGFDLRYTGLIPEQGLSEWFLQVFHFVSSPFVVIHVGKPDVMIKPFGLGIACVYKQSCREVHCSSFFYGGIEQEACYPLPAESLVHAERIYIQLTGCGLVFHARIVPAEGCQGFFDEGLPQLAEQSSVVTDTGGCHFPAVGYSYQRVAVGVL